MFLSALLVFGQKLTVKIPTATVLISLIVLTSSVYFTDSKAPSDIDYSYCRKYVSDPDPVNQTDDTARPVRFMGWTWDKTYYITTSDYTGNFFRTAFTYCGKLKLQVATFRTACEYDIARRWFKDHFPTNYSAWIGGIRLGDYKGPSWLTGEPIDMTSFGVDIDYVGGEYYPGTYNPIRLPWDNCLSVSRNCDLYTSGPTNPCVQTKTKPEELIFKWRDCKEGGHRVICMNTTNFKKDTVGKEKNFSWEEIDNSGQIELFQPDEDNELN